MPYSSVYSIFFWLLDLKVYYVVGIMVMEYDSLHIIQMISSGYSNLRYTSI